MVILERDTDRCSFRCLLCSQISLGGLGYTAALWSSEPSLCRCTLWILQDGVLGCSECQAYLIRGPPPFFKQINQLLSESVSVKHSSGTPPAYKINSFCPSDFIHFAPSSPSPILEIVPILQGPFKMPSAQGILFWFCEYISFLVFLRPQCHFTRTFSLSLLLGLHSPWRFALCLPFFGCPVILQLLIWSRGSGRMWLKPARDSFGWTCLN